MDSTPEIEGKPRAIHASKLRKFVVAVIGGTVLVIGILLLVLPGPAMIVIPIGLVILASEFAWARYVLRRGKRIIDDARHRKWREVFFGAGDNS